MRLFVEMFSLVFVILGVLLHKIYAQGLDYFSTSQTKFSSEYAVNNNEESIVTVNQIYPQNVDRHSTINLHETETTQQLATEQPVKRDDISRPKHENTSGRINTSIRRQKSVHAHSHDPSQTETFLGQVTLDSPADLPPEFTSREIANFEQPSVTLFNINKQVTKPKHVNKSEEEIFFLGNNAKDNTTNSTKIGTKTNLTSQGNVSTDNDTKSQLEKVFLHSTIMPKISDFFFKSDKKSLMTSMDLKLKPSKFEITSRIKSINLEGLLEEPINDEEYKKHNNQDVEVIKPSAQEDSPTLISSKADKNKANYTYTTNGNEDFDDRNNHYTTGPTVIVKYNRKNSHSQKENLKNKTRVLVLNESKNSSGTPRWIYSISTAETTKDPSMINIITTLLTTSHPINKNLTKTTTLQLRTEEIENKPEKPRSQDSSTVTRDKKVLLLRSEIDNKSENSLHHTDNLGYNLSNKTDDNLLQPLNNKSSFKNFNKFIFKINTTESAEKLWTIGPTNTMKIKALFDKHFHRGSSEKRIVMTTSTTFNTTQGLKDNSKETLDTTVATLSHTDLKNTSFPFSDPHQVLPIVSNGEETMNNRPTLGHGLSSEINVFNRPLALVKLWTRTNINFAEQPAQLIAEPTPTTSTPTGASTSTVFTICQGDCELAGIIKLIDGVKWIPELLDKNTEEWHVLAIEIQSELEKVYKKSELLKKWCKKIRVDGFSEGSVIVDYIVELNDIGRLINTLEIKRVFHESLDDVISLDSSKVDRRKSNLGNFTIDPKYTDFIVLPHIEPTAGYAENIFLPQWAIAVIVIGLASFLFVIIFGITMLTSRRKMSKKKLATTFSEDVTEMNTKHVLEIEYYNKNLCNVD